MKRPDDKPPTPLDPTLPLSASQPPGAPVRFAPGRLVAERYRVVRFLAGGGMGEVYEAEDTGLRERVALKAVRARAAADAALVARFKREIALARRVTHPNACRIFDMGVDHQPAGEGGDAEDVLFLTMELLEGETLAERLRREGRLALDTTAAIAGQVAAALDAAHAAGVVHRDLKTSNVLLVPSREAPGALRAVVTDFGLAREVDNDDGAAAGERVTGAVQLVGTPAYMAPEQVEGGEVTAATDVYAFGVVLFELVTGRLPFVGESPLATAIRRVKEPAPSPRRDRPDLPAAWEAAILRCLALDPAARFGRASEATRALAEGADGTPAGAVEANAAPSPSPPPGRRRAARPALAAALAVAAAAAIVWRVGAGPGRAPTGAATAATGRPAVAVLGFKNLAGRADLAWISPALAETLVTELGATERLRLVPGEAVARTRADLTLGDAESYAPDTLARLRANLGADYIVVGAYLPAGGDDGLRVDLRVQDTVTGETTVVAGQTGTTRDLAGLVARAAPRLYARLGVVPPAADAVRSARASLPAGAAAAQAWAEGLERLRALDCRAARDLLVTATQADPRHAPGHAALAEAWACLGDDGRAREAAGRAFELSADLGREDRLRIEAIFRRLRNEHARVVDIYRALWEFFPDVVDYGVRLARAQEAAGDPKGARVTLDAVRRAGGDGDPEVDLLDAQLAKGSGEYERMRAAATRAAAAARSRGARILYGRARLDEAWALRFLGRTAEAAEAADDARRQFVDAGNRTLEVEALNTLGGVYMDQSDLARALATRRAALEIARELGNLRLTARLSANVSELIRVFGKPNEALELAHQARAMGRELGDRAIEAFGIVFAGNALLEGGAPREAVAAFHEALPIAEELGRKEAIIAAEMGIAMALTAGGDVEGARKALERCVALHAEMGTSPADPRLELARVFFVGGDLDRAEATAEQALREADRQRALYEAEAYALLADVAVARGRPADAAALAARAVEAGSSTGAPGLRLPAQLAAGRARAAGAADRAALAAVRADLEAYAAEAEELGLFGVALEARLALGRVELAAGAVRAGRTRLSRLAVDAEARGYRVIARDARRAAQKRAGVP